MVWHKYDCIGCHTVFGNRTYFAPDMTKMAARKPTRYLKQFIMDTKSVNAQAVMPKFGITSDEADNLLELPLHIRHRRNHGSGPH